MRQNKLSTNSTVIYDNIRPSEHIRQCSNKSDNPNLFKKPSLTPTPINPNLLLRRFSCILRPFRVKVTLIFQLKKKTRLKVRNVRKKRGMEEEADGRGGEKEKSG